jgi:NADH-quinone oxidoreductase subunit E
MDDVRRDLSPALADLPRERQYLLPALQRVQEELGSLPLWALETVGLHVRVPKSEVYGVATHSPELRLDPPGTHVVRVCTGVSCYVLGAPAILRTLLNRLDTPSNMTRARSKVTVEETACAFICGVAPVVEVDGVPRGAMTPREAETLATELGSR